LVTDGTTVLSDSEIRERKFKPDEANAIKEKLEGLVKSEDREGIRKVFKDEIGDRLLICPFEDNSLQASSYDLRVGEDAHSITFGKLYSHFTELELQPRECVNIKTLEYVALPTNMTGFIHSKVGVVLDGLAHVSTKVDPGFFGNLMIAVYNNANRPLKLSVEKGFCAISFIQLKSHADNPYFARGEHLGVQGWDKRTSSLRPLKREEKDNVDWDFAKSLFDTYGKPFDSIYWMFEYLHDEFKRDLEQEHFPKFKADIMKDVDGEIHKNQYSTIMTVMTVIVVGFMGIVLAFIAVVLPHIFRH
jgi:deoxycytidine triphosphate deaminase